MDTDRNLLFGVLALQLDLLDAGRFAEACAAWAARKDTPLADLLVERGWLTGADRALLDALLNRQLQRHGGDVRASLAAAAGAEARRALGTLDDSVIQHTLSSLGAPSGQALPPTPVYEAGAPSRYTRSRLHARGGLGQVWLARDAALGRAVALKELRPDRADHPVLRGRFLEEAKITGQLEHPGIVPVYELSTRPEDGQPFYTMRFVRGRTLTEAARDYHARRGAGKAGALEQRELLTAFVAVCNAVAYAHSRGVLHRDLKGSNVVLGDFGEVLVLDWGLAKVVGRPEGEAGPTLLTPPAEGSRDETVAGQVLGTPGYMAPEQAAGRLEQVDRRSDVYGLGAILYEILTGRPPFSGPDSNELLRKVLEEDPPRPRQAVREAPPALEAVCLKALARAPQERYGSAAELAEEVYRYLADEPVAAYPEPAARRLGRWGRKHKPLVAGAAALALAALAALAVNTVLLGKEQARTAAALADKERAERERGRALVDALRTAEPAALAGALEGLGSAGEGVLPLLQAEAARPGLSEKERVRLALALLPSDPSQAEPLKAYLLKASPQEFLVVREALRPHAAEMRGRLWELAQDPARPGEERFRAACALAAFDPGSDRWAPLGRTAAADLAARNPLFLGDWLTALRPVRDALRAPLQEIAGRGAKPESRYLAASALAEYFRDRADVLAELAEEADARQFAVLLPALKARGAEAAGRLEADLKRALAPDWKDGSPPPGPAPEPRWRQAVEQAHGLLEERFALVQTLPLANLVPLAEGLRGAGYRPVRVRPYRAGDAVRVAAVWHRDGRDWRLSVDVPAPARPAGGWLTAWVGRFGEAPAGELQQLDRARRKEGFVPADVAEYTAPAGANLAERFAAVWVKGEGEHRLLAGVPAGRYKAAVQEVIRAGLHPRTLQQWRGADGEMHNSAVWGPGGRENWQDLWGAFQGPYEGALSPSSLQLDVSLTRGPPLAAYRGPYDDWAETLDNMEETSRPGRSRAVRLLGEGKDQEAVTAFTAEIGKSAALPVLYPFRAIAYARLGKRPEALQDLATNRDQLEAALALPVPDNLLNRHWRSQLGNKDAYGRVVALAYLGEEASAVTGLEALVAANAHNGETLYAAALAYAAAARVLAEKRPADGPARARRYSDRALELLEQARANGADFNLALETHPDFQAVRSRPEFQALLRRLHPRRRYAAVWQIDRAEFVSRESHGLSPEAHRARCRELADAGFRPVSISAAVIEPGRPPVTASVWRRPTVPDAAEGALARRQANAAVALLHLGRAESVWTLLRQSPDPRRRTYLVHRLSELEVEPAALTERFAREADVSARRALLLGLGLYKPERAPEAVRAAFLPVLLQTYREAPDPGLHAAAGWLLRRWGRQADVARLDKGLAGRAPPPGRRWLVNRQGQTFTVVPGPTDCRLGSPGSEADRGREPLHPVRIGRTFAVAAREVSVEEFHRFRRNHPYDNSRSPDRDGPIIQVSWFEAAQYCRWLSEQEGVPEDQMCFPPVRQIGPGMALPRDYLSRTGYRLPTEAEWECACRAGTVSSRHYGDDVLLLPSYAWFAGNAGQRAHPLGLLPPNDWGLFDTLGNVGEWCLDAFDAYPLRPGGSLPDVAPLGDLHGSRVIRGVSFENPAGNVRCAFRTSGAPGTGYNDTGFRLARTLPPPGK